MTDRTKHTPGPAGASKKERSLASNKAGTTAVEFGLIGFPALLLILAILEVGYSNFMQERLDAAVRQTGRLVLTGNAQTLKSGSTLLTPQQFLDQVLCPRLPATMNCKNVFVNIATVPATTPSPFSTYVNAKNNGLNPPNFDNTKNSYNLGSGQDYVVVQVAYPLPLLTPAFLTSHPLIYKGKPTRLVQSFAAFKNEPF
jgi:Flp pilus assembly protein TadG